MAARRRRRWSSLVSLLLLVVVATASKGKPAVYAAAILQGPRYSKQPRAPCGASRPPNSTSSSSARAREPHTWRRSPPPLQPPPAVTAPPSRRNIAQEGATEASHSHQTWSQNARARMRTDERTDDLRGLPLEAAASALCQRPSPPLGRHPPP